MTIKSGVKTIKNVKVLAKQEAGGSEDSEAAVNFGATGDSDAQALEEVPDQQNDVTLEAVTSENVNGNTVDIQLDESTTEVNMDDVNIHNLMDDLTESQQLDSVYEEGENSVKKARDAYVASLKKFSENLKSAKPVVHNCEEDGANCNQHPMIFEFPITTFGVMDEDFIYVYSVPNCWVPDLPTPYLENKVIKTCLTASASAKRIAEKAVKENTEGVFNSFDKNKAYTCQHMLLNNSGEAKIEKHKCVDFSEGTNLVRCFFEIHSEFQFSVNYRCFYPELWETWYLSFKRVYLAMRAKGY